MDVRFTEEQERLRESVRAFLAQECPLTRVREWMERDCGGDEKLWEQMAELGWWGLVLPQEYGGSGLGPLELVVMLEEMGKVLIPGRFFSTVVLAGLAIEMGGSPAQKQRFLPQIAEGRLCASLAQLEANGRWGAEGVRLPATPTPGGFRLDGTKLFVQDADSAQLLVVPVRTGGGGSDGITLVLLDPQTDGVAIRRHRVTDPTRCYCELTLSDVVVGEDAVLGAVGAGWPILARLHDAAKVALCAEMCGGSQRVLDMTIAFAKTREQFGHPIGAFQAIQHKCADMLLEVEGSKSATYAAAWALVESEPDAHRAACMAKAYCSDAYAHVAGEGIQIHGGLGFTWEQDPHLFYKRAKVCQDLFGNARENFDLVAETLLD